MDGQALTRVVERHEGVGVAQAWGEMGCFFTKIGFYKCEDAAEWPGCHFSQYATIGVTDNVIVTNNNDFQVNFCLGPYCVMQADEETCSCPSTLLFS